jgi:hypothetical protein
MGSKRTGPNKILIAGDKALIVDIEKKMLDLAHRKIEYL